MRVRFLFPFVLVLSFSIPSAAQTTSSSPQALQYLQQALSALSGSTPTSDVTLSGTAHRIAGSDDETGTATLKAIAGASRVDLNLSSGPRSEIQNPSGSPAAGAWSGPDGVSHPISYHNLMLVDPSWFFPAFPISRGLATGYTATYIGHETHNGQAVEHVAIYQTGLQTPAGAPTLAHLSQMDFFLDSTTFLPAAATFNIHADNDAGLDIPIEIRFSDYRSVNGAKVPFHVEKYLNNGLILDLQFQNVTLNTGLTASSFSL